MSAGKRRLDRVEGSLSPSEAILHWMEQAHQFGSLAEYFVRRGEGTTELAQQLVTMAQSEALFMLGERSWALGLVERRVLRWE